MITKERLSVPCIYERDFRCDCPCHRKFWDTDEDYQRRLRREKCTCRITLFEYTENYSPLPNDPIYNVDTLREKRGYY